MILEISTTWPWVRRHECPKPVEATPVLRVSNSRLPLGHATWVILPDGELAWLHHHDPKMGWIAQRWEDSRLVSAGNYRLAPPAVIPKEYTGG